eukprot:173062-Chlamydomonas_euryale.AAC.1
MAEADRELKRWDMFHPSPSRKSQVRLETTREELTRSQERLAAASAAAAQVDARMAAVTAAAIAAAATGERRGMPLTLRLAGQQQLQHSMLQQQQQQQQYQVPTPLLPQNGALQPERAPSAFGHGGCAANGTVGGTVGGTAAAPLVRLPDDVCLRALGCRELSVLCGQLEAALARVRDAHVHAAAAEREACPVCWEVRGCEPRGCELGG